MNKRNMRRHRGFTLIELLVVLAILAMLAGLVGPKVMSALSGSKTKTAKLQIHDLGAALDIYRLDMGHYPSSSEGLRALVQAPGGGGNWNGPYLGKSQVPKDPWGNDYEYKSPGEHGDFDIYSLGADKAVGGDGENQDVGSWQ